MVATRPTEVHTREDFIEFILKLSAEVASSPEEFENLDTSDYLSAAAEWTADMDGYFTNVGLPIPLNQNWTFIATILAAALPYE